MRRTRFMSLCFLVLSLAFFGVREFRWALEAPVLGAASGWWTQRGPLSPERLLAFAREAEARGDAAGLAFVALHLPGDRLETAAQLAEKAVALDTRLTWLYGMVALAHRPLWRRPELAGRLPDWIRKLQAADSDNALPWLLEAELERERRGDAWPERTGALGPFLDALARETGWRQAMAAALQKPRYESYARPRFELERTILRAHGWATPGVVYISVARYPLPNLNNVGQYASLVLNKLGPEAERAGRQREALDFYWGIAHFGERMRLQAHWLVDQMVGQTVQVEAYQRLGPLLARFGLARGGQSDFRPTLEYAQAEMNRHQDVLRGRVPLEQTSNFSWSVLLVHLAAGLLGVFGLFTLVCTGYVNLKRWVRPHQQGPLYQFLTVSENYAPIALFLSCLILYLSYYPYAQNFHYYMTAEGPLYQMEALGPNIFPSFFIEERTALPLTNPFATYFWYFLAGVVLLTLIAVRRQRASGADPRARIRS